jgi:GNAT superfamily N-acetyltransferase
MKKETSPEGPPPPAPVRLSFHPANRTRWKDLAGLFGERGACGGCWCMAWRLEPKQFKEGKGARNRRALKRLVDSGETPGVLAYDGRKAVGWCAVAPRSAYSFLSRSRILRKVDDSPVWSVSCLFILKSYRRRGISSKLLEAAVRWAGTRGATVVEGYPSVPYARNVPAPFLWTGTVTAFRLARFEEVERRSHSRPILRARVARLR